MNITELPVPKLNNTKSRKKKMINSEQFRKMLKTGVFISKDGKEVIKNPHGGTLDFIRCLRSVFSLSLIDAKNFAETEASQKYIREQEFITDSSTDGVVNEAIKYGYVENICRKDAEIKKDIEFILNNYVDFAYENPIDALEDYVKRKKL